MTALEIKSEITSRYVKGDYAAAYELLKIYDGPWRQRLTDSRLRNIVSQYAHARSEAEHGFDTRGLIDSLDKRAEADLVEVLRILKEDLATEQAGKTETTYAVNPVKTEVADLIYRATEKLNQGEYGEAERMANRALAVAGNPDQRARAMNVVGQALYYQQDLDGARDAYLWAIDRGSEIAGIWFNLGMVHLEKADRERALDNYEKAIELDEDFANPYLGVSNCYYLQGDYAKAIAWGKRAIALEPHRAEFYAVVCLACAKQGDKESANKFLEIATRKGYPDLNHLVSTVASH